jgi:hypothetical protein
MSRLQNVDLKIRRKDGNIKYLGITSEYQNHTHRQIKSRLISGMTATIRLRISYLNFFLICIVGGGIKVHSTLRSLNGLLCQPRVIMIMEKSVE